MKIKQLSIFLQNRMGSLSKPLEVLTVADVNIRILRLVVDDPEKGKEALEQNNFLVKMTEIIGVEMHDAPGGLTSVLNVIRDNNIDLEYLYAFTHEKEGKAILLLHADDIDALIDVLNKNNIPIVPSDEVYSL